jgi:hypothetical protein
VRGDLGRIAPDCDAQGVVAEAAGYRTYRRSLRGRVVWWRQLVAVPDDTRQLCWLERRCALEEIRARGSSECCPRGDTRNEPASNPA